MPILKGLKRLLTEKFEDYRNRIVAEKKQTKRYLKGKIIKLGSIYFPKETKDRNATKKRDKNYKLKSHKRFIKAKNLKRMQKLSRKKNFKEKL